MINGKQRAYLKSLAMELDATVYIGKNDLTEATIQEMDRYLEAHELVKVKIQEGSELTPKDAANEAAKQLNAEFVQAIGRKFVLYRRSKDNPVIFLPR